ncbi:MAG: DUF3450 domain-containing protein [Idiomarina sp.]
MTKVINKSKIAAAVIGMFAIAGSATATAQTDLRTLQNEEARIHEADRQAQDKVDSLFEQSQDLLYDYRAVVDEYENLKVYNDHVQTLVDDQKRSIESLQRQVNTIDETKQGVVPLMYKMIDALDQFVELDLPIHKERRQERVERLREIMTRSDVTTSEQYRQIIEAYQSEMDYGSGLIAYQGSLQFEGQEIAVDYFHLGRVAFLAQSLDLRNAWIFNNETKEWESLDDEFLSPLTTAIRMARKQTANDLVKLPIFAAESAE